MSLVSDTRTRYFVYRLHAADGAVLYVGRSFNVAKRIKQHAWNAISSDPAKARTLDWLPRVRSVSMFGPFQWAAAVEEERSEIRRLQPPGNIVYTERDPRGGLSPGSPVEMSHETFDYFNAGTASLTADQRVQALLHLSGALTFMNRTRVVDPDAWVAAVDAAVAHATGVAL